LQRLAKGLEELGGDNPATGVDAQLEGADLFVDVFHKLHHEVDKAVLEHGLRVKVGDKEADVVA
jgi:hypothetical protein